ncbi:DsbA family protein [Roseovarius nubinhibens]|uniref:27 kDa outer membrane protein, putative n=1 Tax=Roseovarius nubinhibens (strain ATCC BAA-591 / DSM 15170 / ISM) TaxID=89187 RepID=A3SP32_ROSNI|nr:DsbA family protein [Roseovarius nubinhibens]EAP76222.1 27 kDa outer membrane protein, putative [Roseovarius nubinhibens ISM]
MTRFLTSTALALTLALPAAALDLGSMTDAERSALHDEIRTYLLENPEVIMEAVAVLEQRQQQDQVSADQEMVSRNSDAIFNDDHSWVGGNPEGDITIVEFLDYRCGYCKRAFGEVKELLETDGNIRFIVKEFPILGEASVMASRFAIATKLEAGDEAYESLHDGLMAFNGDITEAALKRLATSFGLDADAIAARMEDEEVSEAIAQNHALAGALQITGTPTFVMGDQMVRGYVPLEGMEQIVAELRKE